MPSSRALCWHPGKPCAGSAESPGCGGSIHYGHDNPPNCTAWGHGGVNRHESGLDLFLDWMRFCSSSFAPFSLMIHHGITVTSLPEPSFFVYFLANARASHLLPSGCYGVWAVCPDTRIDAPVFSWFGVFFPNCPDTPKGAPVSFCRVLVPHHGPYGGNF